MNKQVIGVMDSGVGGLTVVKEIMRQLPQESIYYFGDTLRCPYGPRSNEEVDLFTQEIVSFLIQFPLKALVIACNTATAVALAHLQKKINIPVLGVIKPGARAAIKVSKKGKIGVIGTQVTIRSKAYEKTLKKIHPELDIYSLACPAFVPLVEKGLFRTTEADQIVNKNLSSLKTNEIDTLILGCTHYPLLSLAIAKAMDEQVLLINSAEETAVELSAILHHKNLLSRDHKPLHRFFATGSTDLFAKIAKDWLATEVTVQKVGLNTLQNGLIKVY